MEIAGEIDRAGRWHVVSDLVNSLTPPTAIGGAFSTAATNASTAPSSFAAGNTSLTMP